VLVKIFKRWRGLDTVQSEWMLVGPTSKSTPIPLGISASHRLIIGDNGGLWKFFSSIANSIRYLLSVSIGMRRGSVFMRNQSYFNAFIQFIKMRIYQHHSKTCSFSLVCHSPNGGWQFVIKCFGYLGSAGNSNARIARGVLKKQLHYHGGSFFLFSVLEFELSAYTLSHSTGAFLWLVFFSR
jgi:hypothetical protein